MPLFWGRARLLFLLEIKLSKIKNNWQRIQSVVVFLRVPLYFCFYIFHYFYDAPHAFLTSGIIFHQVFWWVGKNEIFKRSWKFSTDNFQNQVYQSPALCFTALTQHFVHQSSKEKKKISMPLKNENFSIIFQKTRNDDYFSFKSSSIEIA